MNDNGELFSYEKQEVYNESHDRSESKTLLQEQKESHDSHKAESK